MGVSLEKNSLAVLLDMRYELMKPTECGVRSAECGVRSAEYGVWSMEHMGVHYHT